MPPSGMENKRKVLYAVVELYREQDYPLTVREICDKTGISSTSQVYKILRWLRDRGEVLFEDNITRTIRPAKFLRQSGFKMEDVL